MPPSGSWLTLSAQALQPSAPGPCRCGVAQWQGPQLPPVCVVISVVSLSSGPHDAGHLLQQQRVVPVNHREPLLLQLRADTQGDFKSTSCVCVCYYCAQIYSEDSFNPTLPLT